MAKKTKGREDRLSDLPDSILIHILSMMCEDTEESKRVVRTSVLSIRWRFLWMSVPVSLDFFFPEDSCSSPGEKGFVTSTHRELHYWRSCQKIRKFKRLEISNVKSRKLIIEDLDHDDNNDEWLEIIAPYIQKLKITGSCDGICLRNVASLVTAVLDFDFEVEIPLQRKESTCLKELFQSVAHVEKLELGRWCIEYLSILELEGWQPPSSSWKFLQLSTTLKQLDFPGICSFLQSSLDLETLLIDGYSESRDQLLSYTNKDEQTKRFETHNFNGSFPHLKTVKILNFSGSVLPFVKYLLKHAIVLEKFVIVAGRKRSDVSPDYVKVEHELLSFPRSSPQASVFFSYE